MHDMALKIISCFAVGLGKSPDYFEPWFKKECASVFRGLHYLPRSKNVVLDDPNE
jgi:isopenicillin N synthase-like dioxygenase